MLKVVFGSAIAFAPVAALCADADQSFGCFELQTGSKEAGIKFFETNLKNHCFVDQPFSIFPSPNKSSIDSNVMVCCHLTGAGKARIEGGRPLK